MSNGWTPERRAKQAAAIRQWLPWANSTGPRTTEGKRTAAQNAPQRKKQTTSEGDSPRMSIPKAIGSAIDNLLGRRTHKLSELLEKRDALVREHEALSVAPDDGAAAARVHAKLESLDADIRAARAALDAADRHEKAQKEEARRQELQRLSQARDEAAAKLLALLKELSGDMLKVADKIKRARRLFVELGTAAKAAGTPDFKPAGLTFSRAWGMLWRDLHSAVQEPGMGPLMLPNLGSNSRDFDSLAVHIDKNRDDPAHLFNPEPKEA